MRHLTTINSVKTSVIARRSEDEDTRMIQRGINMGGVTMRRLTWEGQSDIIQQLLGEDCVGVRQDTDVGWTMWHGIIQQLTQ